MDRRALTLVFVLFHGAAVALLSIPPPPPGLRGDEPDPQTERSLSTWVALASSLGLPREAVDSGLRAALPAWATLLGAVQAPLRPYADLVGAQQSWRMFGTVPAQVASIEIDAIGPDGRWAPLYRSPSSTHRWQARLLRQERVRALLYSFGHRQRKKSWARFTELLAQREERTLRFRMRELTIPPPGELARTGELAPGPAFWERRP
jgi:hypothetical protein